MFSKLFSYEIAYLICTFLYCNTLASSTVFSLSGQSPSPSSPAAAPAASTTTTSASPAESGPPRVCGGSGSRHRGSRPSHGHARRPAAPGPHRLGVEDRLSPPVTAHRPFRLHLVFMLRPTSSSSQAISEPEKRKSAATPLLPVSIGQ